MNVKLILKHQDGSDYGVVPEIDGTRIAKSSVVQHVDTFFTYGHKVPDEQAYVFYASGPIVVLGDEELA